MDADYRTDGGPKSDEIEASIAAAIFHTSRPRLYAAMFSDEKATYKVSFYDTPAALFILENPTPEGLAVFDDPSTTEVETRDPVILRSLAAAIEFLRSKQGRLPRRQRLSAAQGRPGIFSRVRPASLRG